MHLFSRFLSLRRRARKNTKSRSRESSGSSFEYGQPSVDRLSGDFDPYQYSPQAAGHPNFDLIRSAGIPIRTTTPRSFSPPEHPIDHVPRRDQKELASPPLVKVYRKKLLQRTEFPHADPPRSPRKVSQAEFSQPKHGREGRNRSIRRVESVYSDSSEELAFNSPRLENLRRDPSVLSLVSVMDSHGTIPSDVFTNSPETPNPTYTPCRPIRYARAISKSTPDLSASIPSRVHHSCPGRDRFNSRINAVPEALPTRPRSEFLVPSFPLNIFPSQTRCATPESHSFSSLQGEQGSFSLTGDSTQKPHLSTHKSLTKASDAFRFLEDRYAKHLPPTHTDRNQRGPSANDAVIESSSTGVPGILFAHEREGQTLPLSSDTCNLPSRIRPVCFSRAGAVANASTASHISHSRVISPLDSPLPVLTRIQPYASSFSRTRYGTNQTDSSSGENGTPSSSQSLWESSRYSPPSAELSPRTPRTTELIQLSPRRARIPASAIIVSPSQISAYEQLKNKKLASGPPACRDTDFADQRVIRVSRPLHATSRALDRLDYDYRVPTQSVYMQPPAQRDQHTWTTRTTRRTPIQEDRTGLGISFNFNSGNNTVGSDSMGDCLNNDQEEITPGRPTVVLVPSGRRADRGEAPASASAPASVKPDLGREQSGPLFAPGLDPHSLLESASQSSISCTSSFHTAREELVETEHPYCAREFGDERRYANTSGTHTVARPPRLHLDLSSSPLVATAGPATQVSSSWSQDRPHHGAL